MTEQPTSLPEPSQVLTPPVTDLMAVFHAKVGQICEAGVLGEPVSFIAGATVAPTDQMGNFTTVFILTLAIPSLVIGQMIHTVVLVPNLWIDEDALAHQIREMINGLIEERTRMSHETMNGADLQR